MEDKPNLPALSDIQKPDSFPLSTDSVLAPAGVSAPRSRYNLALSLFSAFRSANDCHSTTGKSNHILHVVERPKE